MHNTNIIAQYVSYCIMRGMSWENLNKTTQVDEMRMKIK